MYQVFALHSSSSCLSVAKMRCRLSEWRTSCRKNTSGILEPRKSRSSWNSNKQMNKSRPPIKCVFGTFGHQYKLTIILAVICQICHNIKAHTKFGVNPLTFTPVIVRKRKYRRTHGRPMWYFNTPSLSCGGVQEGNAILCLKRCGGCLVLTEQQIIFSWNAAQYTRIDKR